MKKENNEVQEFLKELIYNQNINKQKSLENKINIDYVIERLENILKNERVCSQCSAIMHEGYVIDNGLEYYCSDDCLHKNYSDYEYNELYAYGNGDSYWTSWE